MTCAKQTHPECVGENRCIFQQCATESSASMIKDSKLQRGEKAQHYFIFGKSTLGPLFHLMLSCDLYLITLSGYKRVHRPLHSHLLLIIINNINCLNYACIVKKHGVFQVIGSYAAELGQLISPLQRKSLFVCF